MKLGDGEDITISEELEENSDEKIKNNEDEENEIDETGEAGEQGTNETSEFNGEGTQEEKTEAISDGSEGSEEQTTTIEVSVDSISMDTNLASLGFVPVALFCIIFLLGIIALGGD